VKRRRKAGSGGAEVWSYKDASVLLLHDEKDSRSRTRTTTKSVRIKSTTRGAHWEWLFLERSRTPVTASSVPALYI
jgi:hypothetical protein